LATADQPNIRSARGDNKRRRKALMHIEVHPQDLFRDRIRGERELERRPRIIGYEQKRHLLVWTSLLEYNKQSKALKRMPNWTMQIEDLVKLVNSMRVRSRRIICNGKDRSVGPDLIFMALPTGCMPLPTSTSVPSWNKWDDLLPVLFFEAAKAMLTNMGYLVLLYAEKFNHISVVCKSLRYAKVFWHAHSWSVPLDNGVIDESYIKVSNLSIDPLLSFDLWWIEADG
jgi:hypothetical protein